MIPQLRLPYYQLSSDRAKNWLASQFTEKGYAIHRFYLDDLACYYKSPLLFYLSAKPELAHQALTYIKTHFLRDNGDFTTQGNLKSANGALVEYWAYMNGWIAITAQRMGRFDVAYPAYEYLKTFYHPQLGGFTTHQPSETEPNGVDVLTTAHLGLTALYFGDLEKGKTAGNLLQRFLDIQPDLQAGFYLRMDDGGNLLTEFPDEKALFFQVSLTQPDQAYFMIGYPIAFLGKLYLATQNDAYLQTAKGYLDVALGYHEMLIMCYSSHNVAWGAAIIANITHEPKYANFAIKIADYLLTIQQEQGPWLKNIPVHTSFDQTAEIAICLKEISTELSPIAGG